MSIIRKSRYQASIMQKAGEIVAEVLKVMQQSVKPGISTAELDAIAEDIIHSRDAIPTFKGFHGFPASICASLNHEVVHGIPSDKIILKEGDIISIDVGATYKGMVGDSALTIPVGKVSNEVELLLKGTNEALYAGIAQMREGNFLEDVSGAIEDVAKKYGFGIVRQYGGHGVGSNMHEEPFLFNYRTGSSPLKLKSGMVIAIEPMFNLGCDDVHTLEDEWTVVTNDKKPSAHFEHTVMITNSEPVIFTDRK